MRPIGRQAAIRPGEQMPQFQKLDKLVFSGEAPRPISLRTLAIDAHRSPLDQNSSVNCCLRDATVGMGLAPSVGEAALEPGSIGLKLLEFAIFHLVYLI